MSKFNEVKILVSRFPKHINAHFRTWKRMRVELRKMGRSEGFYVSALDLRSVLISLALTIASFLVLNICFNVWSDRRFEMYLPHFLDNSKNPAEAAKRLIDEGWGDKELEEWIAESWETNGKDESISLQNNLLRVLRNILSVDGEAQKEQVNQFERWAKGDPHSFFFIIFRKQSGGEKMLDSLIGDEWKRALEKGENSSEKEQFIINLMDGLVSGMRPPIRWANSINGFIQALTVQVFFFFAVLCFRRYLLVYDIYNQSVMGNHSVRGSADLLGMINSLQQAAQTSANENEGRKRLEKEFDIIEKHIQTVIYNPLQFLLGSLPSLGFIGTIFGMGEALGKANQLFTSTDKQRAISDMTSSLGYAFDTTLVALVLALFGGIGLAALWSRETWAMKSLKQMLTQSLSDHFKSSKSTRSGRKS